MGRYVASIVQLSLFLILILYPTHFNTAINSVAVLGYVPNALIFAILLTLFTAVTMAVFRIGERSMKPGLVLLAIFVYTTLITGFWAIHSPTGFPPPGDATGRTLDFAITRQYGHIDPLRQVYYGFPGLDSLSALLSNVTGLNTLKTVQGIMLLMPNALSFFLFVFFKQILKRMDYAAMSTMFVVGGDILIYHNAQVFFPETLGFTFTPIALWLILRSDPSGRASTAIAFTLVILSMTITHPVEPVIILGAMTIAWSLAHVYRGFYFVPPKYFLVAFPIVIGFDSYTQIFGGLKLLFIKSGISTNVVGSSGYWSYFLQLIRGNVFSPGLPIWVTTTQTIWLIIILAPLLVFAVASTVRLKSLKRHWFALGTFALSAIIFTILTLISGYGDPTRILQYCPFLTIPYLLYKISEHKKLLTLLCCVAIALSGPTFFAFNIDQMAFNVNSFQVPNYIAYTLPGTVVFGGSLESSIIYYVTDASVSLETTAVGTTYSANLENEMSTVTHFMRSSQPSVFVFYPPSFYYYLIHFYPNATVNSSLVSQLFSKDMIFTDGPLSIFSTG